MGGLAPESSPPLGPWTECPLEGTTWVMCSGAELQSWSWVQACLTPTTDLSSHARAGLLGSAPVPSKVLTHRERPSSASGEDSGPTPKPWAVGEQRGAPLSFPRVPISGLCTQQWLGCCLRVLASATLGWVLLPEQSRPPLLLAPWQAAPQSPLARRSALEAANSPGPSLTPPCLLSSARGRGAQDGQAPWLTALPGISTLQRPHEHTELARQAGLRMWLGYATGCASLFLNYVAGNDGTAPSDTAVRSIHTKIWTFMVNETPRVNTLLDEVTVQHSRVTAIPQPGRQAAHRGCPRLS